MPDIYIVNGDFSLFVLGWVLGTAFLYGFVTLVTWLAARKKR